MPTPPAIKINDLTFAYNGLPVLSGVNLIVEHGDFLAVLGPNGGGKSTLLKLILGLLAPDRGTVEIYGRPPSKAGGLIGYLPQHTHVSPSFPISVLDAAALGLIRPGLLNFSGMRTGKKEQETAMEALKRVNMDHLANRRMSDLSGGQRQRALIARAMVSHPRLLLLDEPSAGLDPSGQHELINILTQLNADMTIVLVSHDITAVARSVKSIACVNTTLHFHAEPKITTEMVTQAYGGTDLSTCPVELVAHGHIPHRVLEKHED